MNKPKPLTAEAAKFVQRFRKDGEFTVNEIIAIVLALREERDYYREAVRDAHVTGQCPFCFTFSGERKPECPWVLAQGKP